MAKESLTARSWPGLAVKVSADRPVHRGLSVALLSPCYWPEVRRGSERFLRQLADGLIAHEHRPSLITSHPGAPSRAIEESMPVLRLPRPPQRRMLRRGYEPYLTHVPLSYLALRAGAHDLAHAVYPTDALAAGRWRAKTGRPALLSYMGIPHRAALCEYRGRLRTVQQALRSCDAVVALSRFAADAFDRWLGYQARVIHPGVDLGAFRPAPRRSDRPTIICPAAAEVKRKNVGLLVDALAVVRRRHPDARLVLSAGPDREAIRRAGIDLDAPGVEWSDLDDLDVLARAYGEAWVAVLPSFDEAFGLVLVEALACGTPVVGYAHSAIPEIVDRPDIGRTFDRPDPEALAAALLETLELNGRPETALRCRQRAQEFSSERCIEQYLNLYHELLARAPAPGAAARAPRHVAGQC